MLKVAPVFSKGNRRGLDEASKKGLCWFELKRTGMPQWGVSRPDKSQQEYDHPQLSSSIIMMGLGEDDDEKTVTSELPLMPEVKKRQRLNPSQLEEAVAMTTRCGKQRQKSKGFCKSKQIKRDNSKERWSADRYKLAEQNMLEILKEKGAVFENPISRPALRMAARKQIGDTGLLDHLLKHLDGKVAPGGKERFRRCYNTEGTMEYWLESADLVKIKQEAGIPDPNYVPPSWWKSAGGGGIGISGSGSAQDSVSAGEWKLLKAEVEKMKSDMQELLSRPRAQEHYNLSEMPKELVKWKTMTDQCLTEISSSLSGMQDLCRDLMKWRAKSEQQLMEISNSLSSMQTSKQFTTFSPSNPERWEDWLESTNLDDLPGGDFMPLFDNTDLFNVGREAGVRDSYSGQPPHVKPGHSPSENPVCIRELELLKEDVSKIKRDVQELVLRRREEDQANVTPDSSLTTISKPDFDNSALVFQVMLTVDELDYFVQGEYFGFPSFYRSFIEIF